MYNRAFNIGPFEDGKPQQVLPSALADHASEIEGFQKYCNDLVLKLLTLFGIGLEASPPFILIIYTSSITLSSSFL